MKSREDKRRYHPNVLIICGSGQNAGKTSLASWVIEQGAISHEIAAIKVSPHSHGGDDHELYWREGNSLIYIEHTSSSKDSGRFLQAGAKPVLYIETSDDQLETAFDKALAYIGPGKLVVCESGMLGDLIKPGILIFVEHARHSRVDENKKRRRDLADLVVGISEGYDLREQMATILQNITIAGGAWKTGLKR